MKATIILAAILSVATNARAFDAKQCAHISDVDVPYEVSMTAAAVKFHGAGGDVSVTPNTISSGARRYSGALAGGYYEKVRQFLDNAGKMARTANPFGNAGSMSAIGPAATNMCQAILELDASSKAVEHEFKDFASPVRIVLR